MKLAAKPWMFSTLQNSNFEAHGAHIHRVKLVFANL